MGRKTDGAGRRLQRIIARLKSQEEDLRSPECFIPMSERDVAVLAEIREKIREFMPEINGTISPALEKAAQAFGLDPRSQADRDQLLEYFAEAHYGKRERGRPREISGEDLFGLIMVLGHLEPIEHLELRGKTRAAVVAKDLREQFPERFTRLGDRALRQRVTKLLKEYEELNALVKQYEEEYQAKRSKPPSE
jgi:hypothetical protein